MRLTREAVSHEAGEGAQGPQLAKAVKILDTKVSIISP
jgi:hypothetical protein